MITFAISTRAIKIAALLGAIILLGAVASPVFSEPEPKLKVMVPTVMKFELPSQGAKTFVGNVFGMGVETYEGQKIGLAEVRVGPNQAIEDGYVYCVLRETKLQSLFEMIFDMHIDVRCTGTLVQAPEDSIYSGSRMYLIESATTW